MPDTYVIAGAGLAGAKAAETLRQEGFGGRVVLLGAEPDRPYERPPLSKDYLRGESERDAVRYLRDFRDCDALKAALAGGGHAVVIGAGWIGAEVAASARQKGLGVTLVESLAAPLERVLGPELGAIYGAIHRDHGVELLTEAGVEAIEGAGRAERVRLRGGRTVDCDLVVIGVGVAPRSALAAA